MQNLTFPDCDLDAFELGGTPETWQNRLKCSVLYDLPTLDDGGNGVAAAGAVAVAAVVMAAAEGVVVLTKKMIMMTSPIGILALSRSFFLCELIRSGWAQPQVQRAGLMTLTMVKV